MVQKPVPESRGPPNRNCICPAFLDGHHSHISLDLIRTARDSNVILLCLPPNTTHLLQPLDVGVFGPLKTAWRSILKRYKLESRGEVASKESFSSLVAQWWDISFEQDHCKGELCRTGLLLFARKHVIDKTTLLDTAVSRKEAGSTNSMIHSTTD